ncbi:MAG: protein kinase domain-containing protein [Woeseiaceae bacterium]
MIVTKRASELFAEAQERAPETRMQFVIDACGSNQELLDEVRSLLEAAEQSETFFEGLSDKVGLSALADSERSLPENKIIGNWRLKGVIGRGGMGAVYLAERADKQFEQRAALKILPFGLDTELARSRFLTERQILAGLTHGNIARLLDGGVTEEGTPYFVMDYVDGIPIDRYCDEGNLDINARIRLFLGVLAAVSHAHARLIVHRDIKPSNVLVDERGSVRLLDFGVAKLLRPDGGVPGAGLTVELGMALTPEYAAPEQLLGQPVTTATDVYSLGWMLDELLSGRSPRDSETIDSFAALVEAATQDPPKASTVASHASRRAMSHNSLQKKLRGDLDNILQKALSLDPDERYRTANALAADLERYLRGDAVGAMPQTLGYRTQKFVGRHRGGVVTTLLTAIALIVSLVIATSQMVEARKQRDVAIYQQQRVLASNEFLTLLLGEIGPEGDALSLGELLDHGVTMLERSFGNDYRFLGRMYFDLANSYFSLGKTEKMLDLLGRAEEVARTHGDADLLAAILCKSAVIQFRAKPELSVSQAEEANALMSGIDTPSMDSFTSCARANGHMHESQGDRQGAIDVLRTALVTIEESQLASVQSRILVMNQLGNAHYSNGDRKETLSINEAILELMERTGRGSTAGYIINSLNRSVTLQSMGEVKSAFEIRQGLIERVRELKESGRTPISVLSFYAGSLMRLARYEEALLVGLEAFEAAQAAGNVNWAAQDELQIARILIYLDRFDEAENRLDSAEATFRRASSSNDRLIQAVNLARAGLQLRRGDGSGAQDIVARELERLDYPNSKAAPGLAVTLKIAAEIALENGDALSAEEYASDSYDLAIDAARDPKLSANVGSALLFRAKARLMLNNDAASRNDLLLARQALSNGLGEDHPLTNEARTLVVQLQ